MKSFTLIVLLSTSSAFAAESVVGKYNFSHYECASGKEARNVFDGDIMKVKIEGVSEFTADNQIIADHTISYKLDSKFAEFSISMLREALEEAKKKPNNEMEIDMIATQLAESEKLALGDSCVMKAKLTYSVEGDLLTSKADEFSTTCKDMPNDTSTDVQKILATGDVLKLQNTEAGAQKESDLCEAADATVIVYQRIK